MEKEGLGLKEVRKSVVVLVVYVESSIRGSSVDLSWSAPSSVEAHSGPAALLVARELGEQGWYRTRSG